MLGMEPGRFGQLSCLPPLRTPPRAARGGSAEGGLEKAEEAIFALPLGLRVGLGLSAVDERAEALDLGGVVVGRGRSRRSDQVAGVGVAGGLVRVAVGLAVAASRSVRIKQNLRSGAWTVGVRAGRGRGCRLR